MSAPTKSAEGIAAEVKQPCRDCKLPLGKGQYKKVTEGVICKDRPACRSRQLSVELGKIINPTNGTWLFSRRPREVLLAIMDVQPKNWKGEWKPVHTEQERVGAAIEYFSWCYPACLAYAVQIDADDEIITDNFGKPLRHTQRTLAKFLGMHQPNVARAITHRVERELLRVDEETGGYYPNPKPRLTPEGRLDISTDIKLPPDQGEDSLAVLEYSTTIPPKYRNVLASLLKGAPPDISTDIKTKVQSACETYNTKHADIRTARDSAIEEVCSRAATLLSRTIDIKIKRAGVASIRAPLGPHAENRPVDEDRQTPVKELYAPPALDASDLELLAEADEQDRPELEAEMLEAAAEFRRQDQAEAKVLAQLDRETERMRKRGEVDPPRAPSVAGPTPAEVLYRGVPEIQALYPNARFATPRWSVLGKADRVLVERILDALEGNHWDRKHRTVTPGDVTEFLVYVEGLLATTRSPMTPAGPRKLGLLIEWAGDWAREAPERRRQQEDYRAMQALDQARDRDLERQRERDAEIDRRVEENWRDMPAAERKRRMAAALADIQSDTMMAGKWKQLTPPQLHDRMETYAKRVLRREIGEAPEMAQGAGNE